MVIVDEEGSRTHAYVSETLIRQFERELVEDRDVVISVFRVVDYLGQYKVTDLRYKLLFVSTTTIRSFLDYQLSVAEKYILPFDRILSKKFNQDVLFDVVGYIVNIEAREEIMVKEMLLWTVLCGGAYADRLHDYAQQDNKGPIVFFGRLMCLKEWQDRLNVSNSFNSTRVFLDLSSSYLVGVSKLLPSGDCDLAVGVGLDSSPGVSPVSLHDEFCSARTTRKTIEQITHSFERDVCVTVAVVDSVVTKKVWSYDVCRVCKTAVFSYGADSGDEGPCLYKCQTCRKDVSNIVSKYQLSLSVSDETCDDATFLFFDGMAQKLLGRTADELSAEVAESDPSVLPSALASLGGKRMLFKVIIPDDNLSNTRPTYVVEKFCFSEDIIKFFLALGTSGISVSYVEDANLKRKELPVSSPHKSEEASALKPAEFPLSSSLASEETVYLKRDELPGVFPAVFSSVEVKNDGRDGVVSYVSGVTDKRDDKAGSVPSKRLRRSGGNVVPISGS